MGGLFGGAKMPEPIPPPPMPVDKSPAVLEAKRKAAAAVAVRQGRQSTILDTSPDANRYPGDPTKMDSYGRSTLGGR